MSRGRSKVLWDHKERIFFFFGGETQEGLQEEVAFDSGPWGMNFYIWSQMFVAGKVSLD